MIEFKAGKCTPPRAQHSWGRMQSSKPYGLIGSMAEQHCYFCLRVRLTVFDKNGNHIAGYDTREPQPRGFADELPERDFYEGDSPDH